MCKAHQYGSTPPYIMGLFTYYVIIFLKSQTEFCDRRSPQFVVAEGNNISKITGTPIRGQRPPQFIVPEEHKIP